MIHYITGLNSPQDLECRFCGYKLKHLSQCREVHRPSNETMHFSLVNSFYAQCFRCKLMHRWRVKPFFEKFTARDRMIADYDREVAAPAARHCQHPWTRVKAHPASTRPARPQVPKTALPARHTACLQHFVL